MRFSNWKEEPHQSLRNGISCDLTNPLGCRPEYFCCFPLSNYYVEIGIVADGNDLYQLQEGWCNRFAQIECFCKISNFFSWVLKPIDGAAVINVKEYMDKIGIISHMWWNWAEWALRPGRKFYQCIFRYNTVNTAKLQLDLILEMVPFH